jgi:hypothetical protein
MKIVNPFEPSKRQFIPGYKKPAYKYKSAKSVVVPAGANNPSYFVIGGVAWQYFTDIECNLLKNGPGGLNSGSLAASTVYYLYATTFQDNVVLIADLNDPSVGLNGYDLWTYIGAFPTNGSADVAAFCSQNGILFSELLLTVSVTNAAPATSKTIQIPITAYQAYLRTNWTAINTANSDAIIGSTASAAFLRQNAVAGAGGQAASALSFSWVPILIAQTVFADTTTAGPDAYDLTPCGWIEDPSNYL